MSQVEATVIARHTSIKGDLKLEGPAVIAGRVEGSIIGEEVEIAAEGVVEGDIHAAVIDIHGIVKGNIMATHACRLGATASVGGELRAANLSIAEGASFAGQVIVGAAAQEEEAPEEMEETAAVQDQAAAISAVNKTINRIEALATEVDDSLRAVSIAAPAPATSPVVTQGPEIRIFPQTVQTMHRAPRIIKAR